MEGPEIHFVIRGARGGWPVFGEAYGRYGGNTTCFSVETPTGLIVIDAGSGLLGLNQVCAAWDSPKPIAILFSHYHLDHTMGIAGFKPMYDPTMQIQLFGANPDPQYEWKDALHRLIGEPYWPIGLSDMASQQTFQDLDLSTRHMELFGLDLCWCPIAHTQQCLAFQIRLPGGKITIATDHEPQRDDLESYLEFVRGSDVLIQDAQYTPEEYDLRHGWGHGTLLDAANIAKRADVQRLVLTHHDPEHTDEQVDAMVAAAKDVFPNTRGASENMSFCFNTADSAPETSAQPR